ncbi:MAG: MATE family efflux transporter [Halioglobus sp.]
MSDQTDNQHASSSRRVWQLAWPTIISNLLFTTVGLAHIKIVSGLGTSAVAAVTSGHRIFFLIQAVLMGLSIATTAMVARSWGAKRIAEAEMVSWTAIALGLVLGLILSLPTLLVPEAVASLFGLDEETTRQTASFIFWLGVFNIFSALNMLLATSLRATGDVITPLCFLMFSSTFNVLFGYMLAHGIGGLPPMGVSGVALGGSFAAAMVTSVFAMVWWRGKFNLQAVKQWRIDLPKARHLISIGAPSVLEQGFIQIAFLAFFAIVGQYGTTSYAAYGIGISIVSFSIVVGFGFGIAAATLVGQQLGAGHPEQAMKAGWRGLRMALAAMSIFSVLLAVFARDLAGFMIEDEETIQLTVVFIYIIAIAQPIMAVDITLSGALRGAGDTRFPLLATVCGIIFGRLIPAFAFLTLGFSVHWIFAVMILDYIIKSSMLLRRYRSRKWLNLKLAVNAP